MSKKLTNKYIREIESVVEVVDGEREFQKINIDVYCVLKAYNVTDQSLGHAIKKLLMPGQRGNKTFIQDLEEAKQAIDRAIDFASETIEEEKETESSNNSQLEFGGTEFEKDGIELEADTPYIVVGTHKKVVWRQFRSGMRAYKYLECVCCDMDGEEVDVLKMSPTTEAAMLTDFDKKYPICFVRYKRG